MAAVHRISAPNHSGVSTKCTTALVMPPTIWRGYEVAFVGAPFSNSVNAATSVDREGYPPPNVAS